MSKASKETAPRRGRPSLARVKAIEAAIVTSARAMFFTDGFDAVAMEQVATQAGISKGTLYARYPSKEALFKEVIEATIRDWAEEASGEDYLLNDSIEERLRHHARTIAQWLFRPDVIALQRALQGVQERFPQLARTMYKTGYLYIVELIAADIVNAGKRDGIPARDPLRIARMLVAAIAGYQAQESFRGQVSDEEMADYAQGVVTMLMAARRDW